MGPLDKGDKGMLNSAAHMDFLTSIEFKCVELTVLQAISSHREQAGNWWVKYGDQTYGIFAVIAKEHETTARGLEDGWKIIVSKFTQ